MTIRVPSRRGVMLAAVMLIVVMVALMGATLVAATGAQSHGTNASLSRRQARALAWSGVQAAMAELADQRSELLKGGAPKLTREWTLFQSGGRRGVVRLVPVSPESDVIPEASKLNVNVAPEDALARLVGPAAERVVAARQAGPLAAVESIDLEARPSAAAPDGDSLAGSGAGIKEPRASLAAASVGEPAAEGESSGDPRRVLTALSCDPDVQSGLGPGGEEHAGRRRINLARGWSKELGEQIAARFGADGAQAVERVMSAGTKFASASDIVSVLRQLGVPAQEWGVLLDAYSATAGPYVPGRIDINSASAEVISCVPGITAENARAIVGARSRVTEANRAMITWPLSEGILSVEQFQGAIDHITTRSLQWRVRIEAGVVIGGARRGRVDGSGSGFRFESDSGATPRDESISGAEQAAGDDWSGRVVYEAVIDVAGERPRVAYLRDVTLDEVRDLLPRRAVPDARGSGGSVDPFGADAEEPDLVVEADGVPSPDDGPVAEPGTDAGQSPEGMDAESMGGSFDQSSNSAPESPGAAGASERGDDRVGRWSTRRGGSTP